MIAYYLLLGLLTVAASLGLAMLAVGLWFVTVRRDDDGIGAVVVGAALALFATMALAGAAYKQPSPTCTLRPASGVTVEMP